MEYNFKETVNRKNAGSSKWELMYSMKENVEEDTLPLSVADMEFETAPEIKEGLKEYIDNNILGYTIANHDYLEAVKEWLHSRHDLDIKKDWIVNTPGVVVAIYNAINSFSESGDGVIIFRPVYYPFSMAIENTGREIVNVPLINDKGSYKIDYKAFEEECKKEKNKIVIICNPHNPVGRVWREEELAKVVEIAHSNDVTVISDEIWYDLVMPDYKHTSTMSAANDNKDRIVTCTAASKTFNLAGLQLSAILIPNEEMRNTYVRHLTNDHYNSINALGFKGTELAYTVGKSWHKELIKVLDNNRKICEKFFDDNFPQAVYSTMEGTYVFWVDLNFTGKSIKELEDLMIEYDLFFDEGYIFGEEGNGFERINIACPEKDLVKALDRLKIALNN